MRRLASMIALTASVLGCGFDAAGTGMGGGGQDGGSTSDRPPPEPEPEPEGGTTEADDLGGTGATTSTSSSGETEIGSTTDASGCDVDHGGCSPQATCEEIDGRVHCACDPGWTGDGRTCEVDAELAALRIENPCTGTGSGCSGRYCRAANALQTGGVFQGTPGVSYEVTIRVRGVVEEKHYDGGTTEGRWNEGGTPSADFWNIYGLELDDPVASYYVNAGGIEVPHCIGLDYERTLVVAAGATLTLYMQDTNSCQTRNLDEDDEPIVVPDIPPAPDAFEGQFVQIDMIAAQPLP